jgi:hypothetical protein
MWAATFLWSASSESHVMAWLQQPIGIVEGGDWMVEQAEHCEVDLGIAMVASRIDQSADPVARYQYVAPHRSPWRSAGVGRAGNRFGRSAASASTRRANADGR